MNQNYSYNLTKFDQNTKAIIDSILNKIKTVEEKKPKKSVITNILNYSKALKIEKSESLDHFEMVLN